jgi:hypothetical protein
MSMNTASARSAQYIKEDSILQGMKARAACIRMQADHDWLSEGIISYDIACQEARVAWAWLGVVLELKTIGEATYQDVKDAQAAYEAAKANIPS